MKELVRRKISRMNFSGDIEDMTYSLRRQSHKKSLTDKRNLDIKKAELFHKLCNAAKNGDTNKLKELFSQIKNPGFFLKLKRSFTSGQRSDFEGSHQDEPREQDAQNY